MGALDRIADLCAQEEKELAETLAREVLKNDDVEGIRIEGGQVVVEKDRFVGTHPVNDGLGEPNVEATGEYQVKRGDVPLTISTRCMDDNLKERINNLLAANGASPSETADSTPTARQSGSLGN